MLLGPACQPGELCTQERPGTTAQTKLKMFFHSDPVPLHFLHLPTLFLHCFWGAATAQARQSRWRPALGRPGFGIFQESHVQGVQTKDRKIPGSPGWQVPRVKQYKIQPDPFPLASAVPLIRRLWIKWPPNLIAAWSAMPKKKKVRIRCDVKKLEIR